MQYDFNLAPGGGTQLAIKGKFVKYRSGLGMIRVGLNSGGFVDLLPGQGVWGVDYSTLNVSDKSGAANSGIILAGDFDFHDDRITGDVSIIDGGKNRTLSGQTFMTAASYGPNAGAYAVNELWNPAGSGKNVCIESMQISTNTTCNIFTGWESARIGNGTATVYAKKAGAPNSVAIASSVSNGSIPAANFLTTTNIQANGSQIITFKEPVVIPQGYGFVICGGVINATLQTFIEFFEESA